MTLDAERMCNIIDMNQITYMNYIPVIGSNSSASIPAAVVSSSGRPSKVKQMKLSIAARSIKVRSNFDNGNDVCANYDYNIYEDVDV